MLPQEGALAQLTHDELQSLLKEQGAQIVAMSTRIEELTRQVAWYQRQLFGSRSERRILEATNSLQLYLGEELLQAPEEPPPSSTTLVEYERAHRRRPTEFENADSRLNFGPEVPVEVIEVPNPELEGLGPDDYEVIEERRTCRLAQRPGAYVVLMYVRKVVKIKKSHGQSQEGASDACAGQGDGVGEAAPLESADDPLGQEASSVPSGDEVETEAESEVEGVRTDGPLPDAPSEEHPTTRLSCPTVPPTIFDRSFADVSLLAGLAVDKFLFHLPLYRQHQRLEQTGVHLHRGTLTRLVHRTAELLDPIHTAVLSSVLQSSVLTVDETPTKAGRGQGKMSRGYFWGFYGSEDEVAFVFSRNRSGATLRELLSDYKGRLLADGYEVYKTFAASQEGVILHQCWSHTRRAFLEAEKSAPDKVNRVLSWIQTMYAMESKGRGSPEELHELRHRVSKPIMEDLFGFLEEELHKAALLPSNPFLKAAVYAVERKAALMACLDDPAVPLDTNHLEREFRPHAVGRKNWMFNLTASVTA
mgnify:FL=1